MSRLTKHGEHGVPLGRRVALLLGCLGGGCLIGLLVQALSGSAAGFVAVPLLVALAWLFVADPTQCTPRGERPPGA